MRFAFMLFLFFSISAFGQEDDCPAFNKNNGSEYKNALGLNFSFPYIVPLIKYERTLYSKNKFDFTSSVQGLYTCVLFIPMNLNIKYGGKFKFLAGIGFCNYIDFTPYPSSKTERDNWQPDGGPFISYPYNARPDFVIGVEYNFKRFSLSISALNIAFIYRDYTMPPYSTEIENRLETLPLIGLHYKF